MNLLRTDQVCSRFVVNLRLRRAQTTNAGHLLLLESVSLLQTKTLLCGGLNESAVKNRSGLQIDL